MRVLGRRTPCRRANLSYMKGYRPIHQQELCPEATNTSPRVPLPDDLHRRRGSKTYAIHLGVNQVDPAAYAQPVRSLHVCGEDAREYASISRRLAHDRVRLWVDQAARKEVLLSQMDLWAKKLKAGDLLWLTFSGHGGVVRDESGREKSGFDQCWYLYDGPLIDDDIAMSLSRFREGVRVFIVADCCFSGQMLQEDFVATTRREKRLQRRDRRKGRNRFRCEDNTPIKAHILYFSACDIHQKALQSIGNSVFTRAFVTTWQDWHRDKREGSYLDFWTGIRDRIFARQTPVHQIIGPEQTWSDCKAPFEID